MSKTASKESANSSKHNLVKKTAVYIGTSILTQVLNLFLIPIYTNNFTPDLFGEFTIITSFQGILSFFITLGIFSGLSRFYYETDNPIRLKNIALSFSLLWGLLLGSSWLLAAPLIAPMMFSNASDGTIFIRLIVINSFCLCLMNTYTTFLSMGYQALKSSLVTMMYLLLSVGFTIYLVAVCQKGVLGALQAQVFAAMLVCIGLFLADLKNLSLEWDKPLLAKMLSYGMGLLPGQLGCWVLMLIDRYFLKEMIDLNAVGVYSMGYKIGVLIQPLLLIPFKNIFTPYKFEVYQAADGREKIARIFSGFNFVGWLMVLGLSLFASPALKILATDAYKSAYTVVPLVAFAYLILSLGEFYSMGLHIANRTMSDSWIVIGGAVVDVILNYLLIPMWGMYGAAVAVLISYLVMIISYYFVSRKYYQLGINSKIPCFYAAICMAIYAIYFLAKPRINNLGWELLLSVGLCLLYILVSYVTGLLPADAIKMIRKMITKGRNHTEVLPENDIT